MALTTVAELRSTLGVGTLYPDATLQEVVDAADAVLIPMLWAPKWFSVAHSNVVGTGTLYFNEDVREYSISVTTTHSSAQSYHPIFPYGTVSTTTYTDWTTDTAVQNAALMIAVEIWQARTATLSGSNAIDFQPSPYRMSAQLLAKVRGLIAHALDPRSMVG